ncbi:YceI family protein [Longimicrobium sp.]|uniref:YceI family protein n=1 Tax=Longimicrobium sp. TaxID=2029185 RepID=UPI002E32C237|nr:YceI family protein [Longimicrobium sp.]HEX6042357.1 YceI family protein [Longimicrobium sp.]
MRKQLFAGALVVAVPALIAASTLPPLTFGAGSKVWVSGTSTVRGWRCESTQVSGTADAGSTDIAQIGQARGELTIPLSTLDCSNGTMNGHMRNALKAQQNPTIRFRATSVRVTPSGAEGAVAMTGQLTIAGQTRDVTINGTAVREGNSLRVRGTEQLTMTDFGVQPPRLMAGTMRVHAPVTVGFDVILRP